MQFETESILEETQPTENPARALPPGKRILDCALILLLLPVVMAVGGVAAILIRFGSPGPVLFRQQRVGFNGKPFCCFKFRTMRVDAKEDSHRQHTRELIFSNAPMIKLDAKDDPRLVPFGALLRSVGLDELPQLLNVLLGEMSIVGPRPCLPYEYELYEPWQRERCNAVPGLTGLWQVSGKNRTTFNEMVRLDVEYAQRSSVWLDLNIIVRTPPALWRQFLDQHGRKQISAAPASVAIEQNPAN